MKGDEYIQDFVSRKTIGILRKRSNGDIEAIDFLSRKTIGIYRAADNTTLDFFGRPLAKGNILASLFTLEKK